MEATYFMTNKRILRCVTSICCLLCVLLSSTPANAKSGTKTYCQKDYEYVIFSCLTEDYINSLQATVNDIKENNDSITEEELNLYIMDAIEREYELQNSTRTNLPTYEGMLNSAEKDLFASNPVKGLFALSSANTATTWTNQLFESSVTYLGNGDAYRHAFWQAILAEAYGISYAREWGDAHELTSSGVDKSMDLLNNNIGRNLGASIGGNQYIEARISSALLTKISNGELWRVVDGQLCATDGTGRQ